MYLFLTIVILTSILAFVHQLIPPLQQFLKRPSFKERKILDHIKNIKKELSKISIRDDYIRYIKTERKIVSLEKDLSEIQDINKTRDLIIDYLLAYGVQILIYVILIILSIIYRYSPVIALDKNLNFTPFTNILNFPCGIHNAISTPVWIFICSLSVRTIVERIRNS